MKSFTVDPIGYFHTAHKAPYDVPRQAALQSGNEGVIQLKAGCQFEQALEGLEGFDRLWVVFRFHRHNHWKPKVLPPRGGKKQGVFATRSPHRPNFIGLSCVQLQAIKGLQLRVINHDLLDGTPILDLKPYLNYADSFTSSQQGWLDLLPPLQEVSCQWSPLAQAQLDYLAREWDCSLRSAIEQRLRHSPLPYANNRVKLISEDQYELAYRTWRVFYHLKGDKITIHALKSGYDGATLAGNKLSRWGDVPMHRAFMQCFSAKLELLCQRSTYPL